MLYMSCCIYLYGSEIPFSIHMYFHISARMSFLQNLCLLSCRHMNIDLSGTYGTVPEYLLNTADIHSLFYQISSQRMPEHVRRNIPLNPRCFRISFQHTANGLFSEPFTAPVNKEKATFLNIFYIRRMIMCIWPATVFPSLLSP